MKNSDILLDLFDTSIWEDNCKWWKIPVTQTITEIQYGCLSGGSIKKNSETKSVLIVPKPSAVK